MKRHICNAKYSQLGRDFSISVNYRMISSFREDFIFTELPICEVLQKKKTHAKISEFTVMF